MGLFLRKSVKIGPLRLNVSKSGLGVSAGVKGARVSVNPKARMNVHAGRHGVYYRKAVSGSRGASGANRMVGAFVVGIVLLLLALLILAG